MIKDYRKKIITYLIVFLLPIIFMAVFMLYYNFYNKQKNADLYYENMLNQVVNNIDVLLSDIQDLSTSLSTETRLISKDQLDDISISIKSRKIISMLANFEKKYDENLSVSLYPRSTSQIFTSNNLIDYSTFEMNNNYGLLLGLCGLFTKLNNINQLTIQPPFTSSENNSFSTFFVLIPIASPSIFPDYTLCVLIKKEFINKLVDTYFTQLFPQLYMLGSNGELLYSPMQTSYTSQELFSLCNQLPTGVVEHNIDDHKLAIHALSSISGIKYLLTADSKSFYKDTNSSYILLLTIVAILMFFSIIMSVVLAKDYIFKINTAENKVCETTQLLNNKNDLIEQMVLCRLVNGTIPDGNSNILQYNLKCANLEFSFCNFTVVVCQLHSLSLTEDVFKEFQQKSIAFQLPDTKNYSCYLSKENQFVTIARCQDSCQ